VVILYNFSFINILKSQISISGFSFSFLKYSNNYFIYSTFTPLHNIFKFNPLTYFYYSLSNPTSTKIILFITFPSLCMLKYYLFICNHCSQYLSFFLILWLSIILLYSLLFYLLLLLFYHYTINILYLIFIPLICLNLKVLLYELLHKVNLVNLIFGQVEL